MGKGRLKLPDNARQVFPERLSVLLSGREGQLKDGGSESPLEGGEELEVIHPYCGVDVDDKAELQKEEISGNGSDIGASIRPEKPLTIRLTFGEAVEADEKKSDLAHELSQKEINLEKLQRIANSGLPDGDGLRATIWKLLLGYLPPSRDLWTKELNESRQKYAMLKEELLSSPSLLSKDDPLRSNEKIAEDDAAGPLKRREISREDHPLSSGKSSSWSRFFKHTEIAEQIDRDLRRTRPEMKFFCGDSSFSKKNREAMRNILLLFAKLNPAIGYVQGMNEVLAPIFYVFSGDKDAQNAAFVEADSFACFVRLLGDSVDHFCQQLDNSPVGILASLSRLENLLEINDEQLWRHLKFTSMVQTQFYAFRWITLLLTQEFDLHSIMRIWDSLLGNPHGVQDMLLRICCAMLLCAKCSLLCGDFTANLKLLQRYPKIDIEHLLEVASQVSAL